MLIGYLAVGMVAGAAAAIAALVAGMGFLTALLIYSGVGILGLGLAVGVAIFGTSSSEMTSENRTA